MFKYSNAFVGKKLLEQKGVVSWGIVLMQHPDFVLPEIRPLLPQGCAVEQVVAWAPVTQRARVRSPGRNKFPG